MRYFSEYGEDRWLHEGNHLGGTGMVYVDVGAADPVTGSNSAFVRSIGWRGLAIDGNPVYRKRWPDAWPWAFETAIVSTLDEVPFNYHPNSVVSRVELGNPIVPSVTLESLLVKHSIGKIDLLTLDVEGHEFEALASMDLEAHQPRIIVSEYRTDGLGIDWRVRDYLMDRNYYLVHQTFANLIFFRQ